MSDHVHSSPKKASTWAEFAAKGVTMLAISFSVVVIIGYSIDLYRHGKQKHFIGWFSSAGFVLLTIPISLRLIVMHLTHWNLPHIQKYVVRIIWMIPIYAIESWLALRFKVVALYLEKLRESYESYVIFSFFYYLIALLGDEHQIYLKLRNKAASEAIHHKSSLWDLCNPFLDNAELLHRCKFGVFQYVIIKNLMSLIICLLAFNGYYDEGNFKLTSFYLYSCVLNNASQCWALLCLLQFYFVMKDELHVWRPVGKFACVKTVVFFTWWQSILIEMLLTNYSSRIKEEEHWTVNEISKGFQDYLICIEMFFASIAFTFAFTHKDYNSNKLRKEGVTEESRPFLSALLQSSVPDDFMTDIRRWARSLSLSPGTPLHNTPIKSSHPNLATVSSNRAESPQGSPDVEMIATAHTMLLENSSANSPRGL